MSDHLLIPPQLRRCLFQDSYTHTHTLTHTDTHTHTHTPAPVPLPLSCSGSTSEFFPALSIYCASHEKVFLHADTSSPPLRSHRGPQTHTHTYTHIHTHTHSHTHTRALSL